MKKLLHKLPMHVYHLDICVEILVDYEVLQTSPFTAFWKLPTQNCQFYLQKFLKGFEHYIAKTGYRCQSKSKAIAQRTLVQWQQAESSYLSGQQNGKSKLEYPVLNWVLYSVLKKCVLKKISNSIQHYTTPSFF